MNILVFTKTFIIYRSPTRAELTNSIRHSRLVARFNDLYAVDRLDMQVSILIIIRNKINIIRLMTCTQLIDLICK